MRLEHEFAVHAAALEQLVCLCRLWLRKCIGARVARVRDLRHGFAACLEGVDADGNAGTQSLVTAVRTN